MSASFYDLLKYAKTGIASPGMTAYDKMRAVAMAGGKVKTLTGVPPLIFKSNGKPLVSWSMLGNSQQNGTPAPDAPIMPEFVGERTENIYDKTNVITLPYIGNRYGVYATYGTYSIYNNTENSVFYFTDDGSNRKEACPPKSISTVTLSSNYPNKKSGFFMSYNDASLGGVTIVSGSTPPDHHIPYGFQIIITSAGQTTPIYLGQTQTVRRIKKLVLTGEEIEWTEESSGSNRFFQISLSNAGITANGVCTHFIYNTISVSNTDIGFSITGAGTNLRIRPDSVSSVSLSDFKQWISDQYSAGTPVTIWYVLATPETAIVNEPLAKIGDYADELHSEDAGVSIPTARGSNTLTVETDLKPSEMTITYRG